MNIAIFTDAFLPQVNGVVSYVLENATKLASRGHKVTIFAPKPRRGVEVDVKSHPFRTVFLPSLPAIVYPDVRVTIPALPKIALDIRKHTIDIVHIQDPFTVGTDGVLAAKLFKLPLVMTFHTFFLDEPMLEDIKLTRIAPYIQNPLWKLLTYYHNLSSVVISPTNAAKQDLLLHGLKKPCVVIPHGIHFSKKKHGGKSRELIRKRFGINKKDSIGIFVGRLAADKSIDILIRAWKRVVVAFPEAKLMIVGGGPKEQELKELTQSLDLSGNIIFTGEVKREEITEGGLLSAADVFTTTSKIENPSFAILEAMVAGLPVVAVNMRGIPELVDSSNGILVSPDDPEALAAAVVELLKNDKLLYSLGEGSKKRAAEFDIEKTVIKLENLYEQVRNGKNPT